MEANPAHRFGEQHGGKLRAADDLKRSCANDAAAIQTPIYLPSWDHLVRLCGPYWFRSEMRPLATVKADHADAYKRLSLAEAHQDTALVTLRNPADQLSFGLIPKTQLVGSTAAMLYYNCFPRSIASLAFRFLKIPCVGCYDDFGAVAP